ncbi:MAG TPA: YfhO family protein [Acidimicrobiales bacterium]|nr:YfhO family protein [Acidimicrobiales bacterium]
MSVASRRGPKPKLGVGVTAVAVIFALCVALWATVLTGDKTLIGGDILYQYKPWASQPDAHQPRNTYVGDPVTQFVPWLGLVKDSLREGELPLWNPHSLSGTPLLANDQSSPFSPFTLFAALFPPARGISLTMLLKLWVAGIGMALFIKVHGARTLACVVGGIAYATGSFMIVWLAYPHTSVAALAPWLFATLAWYLRDRRPLALVGFAVAVALQFFAGHAETSLHVGFGLAIYLVVRVIALREQRVKAFAAICGAGVLGCLLAGVQLLPFLENLPRSSIMEDRERGNAGASHLPRNALTTWVAPNGRGSPGIDGSADRIPVYPESVGYVGAGAFVAAGFGIWRIRRKRTWEKGALVAVGVLCGAVVYGPLSSLAGSSPLLSVSNNSRFLVVLIFVVAALAGLGLDDALAAAAPARRSLRLPRAGALALSGLALLGLGATVFIMFEWPHDLRDLLPTFRDYLGFWVLAGLLAVVGAVALIAARRLGANETAVGAGFVAIALLEAALFAFPYNPRVPPSEVFPPSSTMAWLGENARGGYVASLGLDLIPDLSVAYRLNDVRGVDTLINRRIRQYWAEGDPKYEDGFLYTILGTPDSRWLAAAGVTHMLTSDKTVVPGTSPVYTERDVVVSEVPGARPFAFAAPSTVAVSNVRQAAAEMIKDPLGPVAVEVPEGADPPPATSAPASVALGYHRPQTIGLRVDGATPSTIVVLQTYTPGWVARVDGKEVPVRAADILFQSIDVPAGSHQVTLRYEPASVKYGLVATALGLLLTVGLSALAVRRAGRAPARPAVPGEQEDANLSES